jgi:hypothetical protein
MPEPVEQTADAMIEQVAEQNGLSDYGHPSFREGLVRLLESARATAALNEIGEQALDGMGRTYLRQRLRVTDWHRTHPEVGAAAVDVPIIIVGLSRSGTTALSHLLGADPNNRSLLGWEAADSVPPPTTETYWSDPRYLAARDTPSALDFLNPEFRTIHEDLPHEPVECAVPLAQHFVSLSLSSMYNVPAYDQWLLNTDLTAAYAWHKQVLQVLQSQCPGPWQLKSPLHLYAIETVARTYPDAVFVMAHRDPVRCVASTCSLALSLSGPFTSADQHATIGSNWPETLATMLDRVVEFRAKYGDDRFVDFRYQDYLRDPVAAVHTIYDRIGREWTPETEQTLRAHVEAKPQNKHGVHSYSLADFGLRREAIEERMSAYLDRFDVVQESA